MTVRQRPEPGWAAEQAREVVGLYGDPDATWGIAVEVGLRTPVDVGAAEARLGELAAAHPHLGGPLAVERVVPERWESRRETLAGAPYAAGDPLVRLAVRDGADGPRLLVAAHHGACDGLGLLAVVASCVGAPLRPRARGIGDAPGRGSFLVTSAGRVVEALHSPPPRFPGATAGAPGPVAGAGEEYALVTVAAARVGTVELCRALAGVFADRAAQTGGPARARHAHPLFVVGASRRGPGTLAPDRQTAYFRFRVDPAWEAGTARAVFAGLLPEPDFPQTSVGGLGPRVMKLLRNRLGSTATVSNLGVVDGAVTSIGMFPAVSGPRAVGVGLASTPETTTVTVRTRTSEYPRGTAADLARRLVDRLEG